MECIGWVDLVVHFSPHVLITFKNVAVLLQLGYDLLSLNVVFKVYRWIRSWPEGLISSSLVSLAAMASPNDIPRRASSTICRGFIHSTTRFLSEQS